jgi:hypothetical protein
LDVELVLDRDRHPQQGSLLARVEPGLCAVCLRQRLVAEQHPERVQLRVEALDPLQEQGHELTRRDLALAQQLGQPGSTGESQFLRRNQVAH